jgi:DUF4097 and DUF4098 domain-containing protein YvlB
MPEFDRSTPVTVFLRVPSGTVAVHAEERTTVVADVVPLDGSDASRQAAENSVVALDGDTLVVRAPEMSDWNWRRSGKLGVTVRVPLDSSIVAKIASAGLRATGRFAEAQVHSASGDAHLDEVTGNAHLDAASGRLTVGRVGGSLRMVSASGDLEIGDVTGDVSAESASGRIEMRSAGGSIRAHTASGGIDIGLVRQGETRIKAVSGDVRVGVAAGTGVWLDVSTVSGSTSNDLTMGAGGGEAQASLQLHIRTVSGDIQIRRATATFPAAA